MTETRRIHTEIRAAVDDQGRHSITLQAITPGVVDDYGSVWDPHCFDAHAEKRMPTLCWAHNWSEPLGPGVEYTPSNDGPQVRFLLSDFDAVPMARRAYAQVDDGTIRDCSVGFSVPTGGRRDPTEAEQKTYPGIREVIEVAELDEVSLVLRGAVPGAKVLALRSAQGDTRQVDQDFLLDLARKVKAGELTEDEAHIAVDLAAAASEPAKVTDAAKPDDSTISEADDVLAGLLN